MKSNNNGKNEAEDSLIEAWFDGACWPKNPTGYASYGAIIRRGGETIWQNSGIVTPIHGSTSNLAEYAGYMAVISQLKHKGFTKDEITVYGDSQLVIEQMSGRWKIASKSSPYVWLAMKAREITGTFPRLKLTWIPRSENFAADKLAASVFTESCSPVMNHTTVTPCSCECHLIGSKLTPAKLKQQIPLPQSSHTPETGLNTDSVPALSLSEDKAWNR